MPVLSFTEGDDSYVVQSPGTYELHFLGGADTLDTRAPFATAYMGAGNDTVLARFGDGSFWGQLGDDRFELWASGIRADGGDGADTFNVRGGGKQNLIGGAGDDRFNFIVGALGIAVNAGDGNDRLSGNSHEISGTIVGGAGDDRFDGFGSFGASVVKLAGGLGNDLYRIDATASATIVENSGEGTDTVQVGRGLSYTLPSYIENLQVDSSSGNAGPASLTGNGQRNYIRGYDNPETLSGLGGPDRLLGQAGNDILHGGDGDDILDGGLGADAMDGGAGDDTYYVNDSADGITEAAFAGTDTVRCYLSQFTLPANVEFGLFLSPFGGDLHGNSADNKLSVATVWGRLYGEEGDDLLIGGDNPDGDYLDGGTGDDTMRGGAGNDTYYVDSFSDVVIEGQNGGIRDRVLVNLPTYTLGANVEEAVLQTAGGTLNGNFANNDLWGNVGDDTLNASFGDDELNGRDGADSLSGAYGIDVLNGGPGTDYESGGEGADYVRGDAGNDQIYGDGGADHLSGGADADKFGYQSTSDSNSAGYDIISDFEAGIDVIDLSGIDANSGLAGDQAFNTDGTSNNLPGDLWIAAYGGIGSVNNYMIYGDVNGDGNADFQILVHLASGSSDQITIVY